MLLLLLNATVPPTVSRLTPQRLSLLLWRDALAQQSDEQLRQHQAYEVSILLLFAYASYLAGEFFRLSGHLAVFFSGAFIRHYHLYSISRASATTFRHLLSTISFLSENFLFLYLGVSLFACTYALLTDCACGGSSGACSCAPVHCHLVADTERLTDGLTD